MWASGYLSSPIKIRGPRFLFTLVNHISKADVQNSQINFGFRHEADSQIITTSFRDRPDADTCIGSYIGIWQLDSSSRYLSSRNMFGKILAVLNLV